MEDVARPAQLAAERRVTAARLTAQLLAGARAKDPVAVARRVLAVQGQDARGVRLAIRSRSSGVSAADVDRALSEERSLLITWLNRGTLHLVASEDYPWLHALTAPRLFTANARRLAQEGVSADAAERGVTAIVGALERDGPLDRGQLRERIERAGVRTEGQALVHLLMLASLRGLTVRGPMLDGAHAYVLVRDWLPRTAAMERERALAELARRYLAGHAPAGERDLARWSGLALGDARAGFAAIAAQLRRREDGLFELRGSGRGRGREPRLPPPRLLGAFDPVLLGWCSREALVGSNRQIVTVNGLFRPFALVDGRAVATWTIAQGAVRLAPFDELSEEVRRALHADGRRVLRFLDR